MAEAIENQPHCEAVDATVHDDRVADAIGHENGYTELTGSLMDVGMRVEYGASPSAPGWRWRTATP